MAKDFSRKFYNSRQWKRTRDYIFKKFYGICGMCPEPGEEVHHKTALTPDNINDVNIALGEDNLILLCRSCHEKLEKGTTATSDGTAFNEEGDLIVIKDIHK